MLDLTLEHLLTNVLPAAKDYLLAEQSLTAKINATKAAPDFQLEAATAKRRAADVAVAIDGLTDRAANELSIAKIAIRSEVQKLAIIKGVVRDGCLERVRAVANAYKHDVLSDKSLPIRSNADVLVTGSSYGTDGYGMGKFSGYETMVRQKAGTERKFLGDVPYAIAGWFAYLGTKGATIPPKKFKVCGLPVN